ncbi:CueP family metal-binding protein [Mariniluteicoccus flavus]
MTQRILSLTLAAVVLPTLLAGCSSAPSAAPAAPPAAASKPAAVDAAAMLAKHNLAGKTPEQVVEALDQDPRPRPLPMKASVRSAEVILNDGAGEARLPLTTDKFYLSIAPWKTFTHECHFHNVGTCRGELARKQVHVTVTSSDGKTLVDTDATTYANGFVGFWIPKHTRGTVKVTAEGMTGETSFDSLEGGATCVTTLKVA